MSLPIPNLDDKTFSDLVEEAKKWIPIYAPEWTDHNVHDPGITLIELFAWLAEMQLYRLNTITEKNKLKFLKLLGVTPKPATAAKADVTFTLNTNSVLVPARTKVAATDTETGEDIVFETDRDIHVVPVKLARIISQGMEEIRDCTEANMLDEHFYHAFGGSAEEGSILYLGFDQPFPANEKIDFMVYLYESDLIERGKHGDE
ncbi:MAG: baseplate J/gp47 family protein, partial [Proteobacteria bacterium]|nr:baseplate J/gp47 family protein [Pseudomonadota bacterium]